MQAPCLCAERIYKKIAGRVVGRLHCIQNKFGGAINLFQGKNTADYRVLLIYPRITTYKKNLRRITPPLGLAYLAAVLEKENYKVSILDAALEGYDTLEPVDEELVVFGLSPDGIKKRIKAFSPHIVGITFPYSCQAKNVLDICKAVKEVNKEIKVAVGGIHASALPEKVLSENKEIDFVVMGFLLPKQRLY